MIKDVLILLNELHLTLGTAESFTGGLAAAKITEVSGASKVFNGSIVSYSNHVKNRLLNVSDEILNKYGAVSIETAKAMCLGASKALNADCVISFTGNAGPEASENKPVGLVFIGILIKDKISIYKLTIPGSRDDVRNTSLTYAFKVLQEQLEILESQN